MDQKKALIHSPTHFSHNSNMKFNIGKNIDNYKIDDYLTAKAVCCGLDKSTNSLNLLKNMFYSLQNYIASEYKIHKDNEDNNGEELFKIHMPSGTDEEGNAIFEEVSIGDFIYISFKSWEPEKGTYLNYIKTQLNTFHYKVPIARTLEQSKYYNSVYRKISYALKLKGIDIKKTDNIRSEIEKNLPELPKEIKDIFFKVYIIPQCSLDKLRTESGIDIEAPTSQEDAPVNIYDFLEKFNSLYKNLQHRTQIRLSLYITIQIMQATKGYLHFNDFRDLQKHYPDLIRDVNWIESVYKAKKQSAASSNTKDSNYFPTYKEQALHIGEDYDSYWQTIKTLRTNKSFLEWKHKLEKSNIIKNEHFFTSK